MPTYILLLIHAYQVYRFLLCAVLQNAYIQSYRVLYHHYYYIFYVEHQHIFTQKLINFFIHLQNLDMLLIINCMHTDTGCLMYCGWCYLIWKSSKELRSEDNFDVIKTENPFSLTVAYPDFLLLNLFIFYILDSTDFQMQGSIQYSRYWYIVSQVQFWFT